MWCDGDTQNYGGHIHKKVSKNRETDRQIDNIFNWHTNVTFECGWKFWQLITIAIVIVVIVIVLLLLLFWLCQWSSSEESIVYWR